MYKTFFYIVYILLISSILLACRNNHTKKNIDSNSLKESLIDANKKYVKRESDEINQYIKKRGWEMNASGTGLRYMIYEKTNGKQAAFGLLAKINYKISLLDGTECYSSSKSGPKEFMIGQDQIESGIHEGILLLKTGEKAVFILPSHLAHGLMGDDNKIPARSTIVYDVELVSLR